MLIVCAGMYRSGSTWQYQVATEMVKRSGRPVVTAGFLEGPRLAEFLAKPRDPATCYLYKTHPPDPIHLTLDPAEVRTLYCYRDLRDVVFSMAYKLAVSFWQAVRDHRIVEKCIEGDAFWSGVPGVFVQRYESWMLDDLHFVRAMAEYLGVELPEVELASIAEEFGLDRNRSRTTDLSMRLTADGVDLTDRANALRHDPDSLLHWNHIRAGKVGDWRSTATPDEVEYLSAACGEWLVARGYESDRSWAVRAA